MPARKNYALTFHGQCLALVLAALREKRIKTSKQDTIAYIGSKNWFNFEQGDLEPYPKHDEPKWHTMMAFGRQNGVNRNFIYNEEWDSWKITPLGLERLNSVQDKFRNGVYNVRHAYLWSPVFKKLMCPSYESSGKDSKRPPTFDDIEEFV